MQITIPTFERRLYVDTIGRDRLAYLVDSVLLRLLPYYSQLCGLFQKSMIDKILFKSIELTVIRTHGVILPERFCRSYTGVDTLTLTEIESKIHNYVDYLALLEYVKDNTYEDGQLSILALIGFDDVFAS